MWNSRRTFKCSVIFTTPSIPDTISSTPQPIIDYELNEFFTNDKSISIDTFQTSHYTSSLISSISLPQPQYIIFELNWLETELWPHQIRHFFELETDHERVILTTKNYELLTQRTINVTTLNKNIDLCHQFLRTLALKFKCVLFYSLHLLTQSDYLDTVVKLMSSQSIEPCFYGDKIYTDQQSQDTKDKILALNADFDFDLVCDSDLEVVTLPKLISKDIPPPSEPFNFSVEFKKIIKEYEQTGKVHSYKQVPKNGNPDDKQLLTDFFSQLIMKADMY